jgi:hypothetical protein
MCVTATAFWNLMFPEVLIFSVGFFVPNPEIHVTLVKANIMQLFSSSLPFTLVFTHCLINENLNDQIV